MADISEKMHAIEITEPGGPEVLELVDLPVPEPEEGEALIKVSAAGINRPDCLQRMGKYPPPPGASKLPGLEVAGEIVAINKDKNAPAPVLNFKEGDQVCALLAGGGYAEYCTVPLAQCLPKPASLSMIEAAGLPETFFTVWNNLFVRGGLKKGETALVHGGSSGIGTTAIQMAKAQGARIIVTAGTKAKCDACLALGADHAIYYKNEDFVKKVDEITEDKGVNVVMDMVGGDYFSRNLQCLAEEGRHVSIAVLRGATAEIDIRQIMMKRLVITASTLRPRPVTEKTLLAHGLYENIWPHLESGKIKPVIHAVRPLAQASEAHSIMEGGDHIGKIILEI